MMRDAGRCILTGIVDDGAVAANPDAYQDVVVEQLVLAHILPFSLTGASNEAEVSISPDLFFLSYS